MQTKSAQIPVTNIKLEFLRVCNHTFIMFHIFRILVSMINRDTRDRMRNRPHANHCLIPGHGMQGWTEDEV